MIWRLYKAGEFCSNITYPCPCEAADIPYWLGLVGTWGPLFPSEWSHLWQQPFLSNGSGEQADQPSVTSPTRRDLHPRHCLSTSNLRGEVGRGCDSPAALSRNLLPLCFLGPLLLVCSKRVMESLFPALDQQHLSPFPPSSCLLHCATAGAFLEPSTVCTECFTSLEQQLPRTHVWKSPFYSLVMSCS